MDTRETQDFAERFMREVWEHFDYTAVPRFYHRDVIGHHRKQRLTYDDVVHRLVTDHPRFPNPKYDIRDIIAAPDRWAIRFLFSASGEGRPDIHIETTYFYHLREGKISEFWLLADIDFDYLTDD